MSDEFYGAPPPDLGDMSKAIEGAAARCGTCGGAGEARTCIQTTGRGRDGIAEEREIGRPCLYLARAGGA